jgi:hypothetical protein
MLLNGVVADALGHARPAADEEPQGGDLCSALCTVLVANAATTTTAILFIGLALFFVHFAYTSAWGLVQVSVATRMVASVCSIQNLRQLRLRLLRAGRDRPGAPPHRRLRRRVSICSGVTFLGALSYLLVVKDLIRDA